MATFPGSKLIKFLGSLLGAGGVDRTLHDKLAETVSAQDFGAVCDGITDDTSFINAALTASPRVFISAGKTSFVNGTILINAGKMLDVKGTLVFGGSGSVSVQPGGIYRSRSEGLTRDTYYEQRSFTGARAVGSGPAGASQVEVLHDDSQCGSAFSLGLQSRIFFGGAAATGGRAAINGQVYNSGGATSATNPNRNYVGAIGQAHAANTDGGTNTSTDSRGAFFGLNGIAIADGNATNLFGVVAQENDTYTQTGMSAKYITALNLVGFNAVRGSVLDAACMVGGSVQGVYGPHIGWKYGFCFTDFNGNDPTASDSILLGSYWKAGGTRTILHGVDLSGFTVTGALLQSSKAVLTDNSLLLGANGANVTAITAGNGAASANLDLNAKGGGGVRLKDGNAVVRILADSGNGITLTPLTSATPGNNGDMVFQLTSNTSLTIKVKGSDGTVRSGSITLA